VVTFFEPTLLIGGLSLTHIELGLFFAVALILSHNINIDAYINGEI
jgi:hypothetical protein